MPIDPYAPCPAGCPKKVKFCCPDLLAELEKVGRLLEGDQRLSCLEYIQKVEEKFPGRACLMTTRAMLQDSLGQHEAAAVTVTETVKKHPQNPVALSQSALLVASADSPEDAVELLQRALEASGDPVADTVVGAIGRVGQLLLAYGSIYSARGHLMLAAMLNPQVPEPLMLLARLSETSVPLVLRDDVDLVPCPTNAPWAKAFNSAMELADRGRWRQSLVALTALTAASGQATAVWRNIAVLRGWLCDRTGAAEAWRKVANATTSHDEAVEAEAMAMLCDTGAEQSRAKFSNSELPVLDMERLLELLASDRRLCSEPVDLASRTEEDQPPPRAVYSLLDRPLPTNSEGLTLAQVPEVLARVEVYGRQTDREPRAELLGLEGPELERALALLQEVAGDTLGPRGPAQLEPAPARLAAQFRSSIRLPRDITPEAARHLAREKAHEFRIERWPATQQPELGDKAPLEAVADPQLRRRVEALILLQEESHRQRRDEASYDAVRTKLGLAASADIDPGSIDLGSVSLARLGRIEASKLDDEWLLRLYVRAVTGNALAAIARLGAEVLRRPALQTRLDSVQVLVELAKASTDTQQAVGLLQQARQAAAAKKQSAATIDLLELAIQIDEFNIEEINRLVRQISTTYAREPGVQQRLVEMLWRAGLIQPGQGGMPADEAAAGLAPAAAAAEEPAIWTPDSERAAGGAKSALWTPGMD